MLKNQSGVIKHALRGANGARQTFASDAGEITFSMATLPKSDGAGKAYYLPSLTLEISGLWTNSSGGTLAFNASMITRALIANINLRDTAIGQPLLATAWVDYAIKNASLIMSGYTAGMPQRPDVVVTTGAYKFSLRIPLPLAAGFLVAPGHTMQLAALYRNGTFGVQPKTDAQSEAVLGVGALSSCTCQLTATLVPMGELLHCAGVELMNYTTSHPASTSHEHVFQDFSNKSGFTGVESGAAIAWLALIGNQDGGPGVDLDTLIRIGVPFRKQLEIADPMAFIDEAFDAMAIGSARLPIENTIITTTSPSNTGGIPASGYPFTSEGAHFDGPNYNYGFDNAWCLPIVSPGRDLKLTKIQQVDEAITIIRTHSSATAAGNATLLACQIKSWTPQFREQWRQMVIESGLAQEVLGTKNVKWGSVKTLGKPPGNAKRSKLRNLPMKLVAA